MNKDRIKKLLPFGIFAALGAIGLGVASLWQVPTTPIPPRFAVKPVSASKPAANQPVSQPPFAIPQPASPAPEPAAPMPFQAPPVVSTPASGQQMPAPPVLVAQPAAPAPQAEPRPIQAQPVPTPPSTSAPVTAAPPDAQVLRDIEFLTTKLDETLDLLLQAQNAIDALKQQVEANEKQLAELKDKLQPPPAQAVQTKSAAPQPERHYVIQPGDTIKSIAVRYGLNWQNLARWNGICDPDRIEVGATLRLTAPQTLPGCQPVRRHPAPPKTHHNWRLIGISDGRAVLQADDGVTTRLVAVGQRDPDLGRILLIDAERRLVKTSRGLVRAK